MTPEQKEPTVQIEPLQQEEPEKDDTISQTEMEYYKYRYLELQTKLKTLRQVASNQEISANSRLKALTAMYQLCSDSPKDDKLRF